MTAPASSQDQRILLRAATSRDALMAYDVLARADMSTLICADLRRLTDALNEGAGAVMVAEEAVSDPEFRRLARYLDAQAPWSDVPVIVLARQGADSPALARMVREFTNVTIIERPVRIASLVSAARSALRARRRQYEIQALLADLHEADQRKTQFLATLAHELRNPLAPIANSLEILTHQALAPQDAGRIHQLMARQIDHMVRLIDDLMEISRITRNKIDMQLAPLSLGQSIADAVELSRPQISAAGHTLSVDLPEAALTLNGDRVRLTQVFSNLLNNAAKYTPAGGTLRVSARQADQRAIVEVSDSGVGLPPHMLEAIFEMFVQVGGTARLAQGGLGIGLTLVKNLVQLHGGQVEARSEGVGQGSTFVVSLPLAEPGLATGEQAADDSGAPALKPHRHVLIVDDNRDAADSLALLLQTFGATVTTAYSGEDALQCIDTCGPLDTAVLDIGMPGLDGCELARELRRRPGCMGMTLIAVTGWGQPEQSERIVAAGFDHHLLKPVDLARLLPLF